MSHGDTKITLVGNLVDAPELRYTPNGAVVTNFRVATTPRRYDAQSGQYVDGDALFMSCNVWKQHAENVANSLTKGMRVIVTGRLRQRSFETQQGEKRTVFEVEVDEVGPALRYATAQVTKTTNNGGGGAPSHWSQQPQQPSQQQAQQNLQNAGFQPQSNQQGGFPQQDDSEEPPF